MIEVSTNNLGKYYGANKIFESLSLDVATGERVGLIGPNGCGKTSLFKILMGKEDYQEGSLSFRKGISVGYLDQMPEYDEETSALEVLESAFSHLADLRHRMKSLEATLAASSGADLDKALKQYGILSNDFENQGGYEVDTKIEKIKQGLKIDDAMAALSFTSLSGGEKTRVILGKILLESPDLLLLDEPSNHLDMDSIEWLESFLSDYQGTAVIISHDRYFLDKVVTRILEMTFSRVNEYHGNYSYYLVEKERRFLIDMKFYMNQQKKIKTMEEQIKRYRIWGTMRDSDKMFRRAKELEKRLEKMDKVERPSVENKKIKLSLDQGQRSGKRALEISELKMAFDQKDLFDQVSLTLFYQDNFCLLGPNGSGKSTLLKVLLGDLSPVAGSYRWGSGIQLGYLPQNVTFENEDLTLLDYMNQVHDLPYGQGRKQLAKVLFTGDDVFKTIRTLSGGEKSRLMLCSILQDHVNCLILDEPTNHLDIDSREVLEETLESFEGTILFISHDRYFIAKLATRIGDLHQDGLKVYEGDYTYYREERLKSIPHHVHKLPEKAPSDQAKEFEDRKAKDRAATKFQKSLSQSEALIESLELKLAKVDLKLDATNDYDSLVALHQEKSDLEVALIDAMTAWEKLCDRALEEV